jgi:DNA-binding helix-hairpin-helix protein with protein kinase domain
MASGSLLKIAAWPTGTLHHPGGGIAGFTMPKVGGHQPIFKLYGPKPRLQEFPTADWRFLIHAASNAARAFATVHSSGLVIGDVNHGNLVVAQDATVRMIDCDSFQVSSGRQTWFCTVGVGTHQPPEMQGRDSYAGIVRTQNHDNFGLAVIVFQLLCMARHPFAGRFLGAGESPSIEDAIAASRYAYSRDRARTKMDVPPGSLPIDALTPEIQGLFEEAFAPAAIRGGRPLADRWVSALGGLAADLKPCRSNGAHFYRKGLSACPWCAIEVASGVTLFPVVFVPGVVGSTGMAALWQEVGKVAEPSSLGPWPPTPASNAMPSPEAQDAASSGKSLKVAAWASVAVALAVALGVASPLARALLVPTIGVLTFLIYRHTQKRHLGPFGRRLADVKQDWTALRTSWATPQAGQSFSQIRTGLSKLKVEYDELSTVRAKRLQRLHEQRRDKQFEEHLDRFSLANAKVPGIGPTKVATLASHGIDTAGDIVEVKILGVPGFGPATVTKHLAWRRGHEQSFRFDPNRGVSPSDVAVVERDIAAHRAKLERDVSAALARLKAASAVMATRHQALHGRLSELGPRYAQALADASVVSEGRVTHIMLLGMSSSAILAALISGVGVRSSSGTAMPRANASFTQTPTTSGTSTPLPVSTPRTAAPPTPLTNALPPDPARRPDTSSLAGQQPTLTKAASSPATVPPINADSDRVIVKQAANVRTSANNTASIVLTAPQGTVLIVFARSAGWLQVGENEPWGWIFSGLTDPSP